MDISTLNHLWLICNENGETDKTRLAARFSFIEHDAFISCTFQGAARKRKCAVYIKVMKMYAFARSVRQLINSPLALAEAADRRRTAMARLCNKIAAWNQLCFLGV